MSTWKPINTAPKDRPIDLWLERYGHRQKCEYFVHSKGWYDLEITRVDDATHWREPDKGPGQEEGEVRWMVEHPDGSLGWLAWKDQNVAIKDARENFQGARVVRVRIVREAE